MNLEWRGIGGQVPVVPTHSFRAIADPRRRFVPDTFREMAHDASLRGKRCGPQQRLHRMPLHTLMAINCQRISPPPVPSAPAMDLPRAARQSVALAREPARLVPQLTRIGLTIINVFRADVRLMA
jgi:hypothetical protein